MAFSQFNFSSNYLYFNNDVWYICNKKFKKYLNDIDNFNIAFMNIYQVGSFVFLRMRIIKEYYSIWKHASTNIRRREWTNRSWFFYHKNISLFIFFSLYIKDKTGKEVEVDVQVGWIGLYPHLVFQNISYSLGLSSLSSFITFFFYLTRLSGAKHWGEIYILQGMVRNEPWHVARIILISSFLRSGSTTSSQQMSDI